MKRREFLDGVLTALGAGVVLGPAALVGCSSGGTGSTNFTPTSSGESTSTSTSTSSGGGASKAKPNILLVLMDEFRMPPAGYGPNEGEIAPIKEIFGFQPTISADNGFTKFFQGYMRLRKNSVVLRNHYIASAACVPSRTAIMTGQYSTLTHATSTDGTFKSADQIQAAGLFLDPNGVPTLGDWFKAAGYDSKYFGKWHVSNEGADQAPWDLSPWGFDCWTESGPEPHGSSPADLGVMRDPGFAVNAVDFLSNQGACLPTSGKPWFAVSSFVNPHDIAAYPMPFYLPPPSGVMQAQIPLTEPQPIPKAGTCVANLNYPNPQNPTSTFPAECQVTPSVALNPDGFPQACFGPPPTMLEDLSTKPDCQLDYSYKFGLSLKAQYYKNPTLQDVYPMPFQTTGRKAVPWTLAYGQFYTYLHYASDLQMRKVLQALDENGLTANTIVVFTADHGEYAGAHGMLVEKWHSMYQEAVHVPFVVSSPLINPSADKMRDVTLATSHIDVAPTLLGLAGFSSQDVQVIQSRITGQTTTSFVGADLSPYIRGEKTVEPILGPDGKPRFGPLFITDDEITAPLPGEGNSPQFASFNQLVDGLIASGVPLTPGPTRQPNHVRFITDGTWKFAKYFDPNGVEANQWEMYYLPGDPSETQNLLNYKTFEVRTDVNVGLTTARIKEQRDLMLAALTREEALMLKTTAKV